MKMELSKGTPFDSSAISTSSAYIPATVELKLKVKDFNVKK